MFCTSAVPLELVCSLQDDCWEMRQHSLLKIRHLFQIYFWYATGSLSSKEIFVIPHHSPSAKCSSQWKHSDEYLLFCSLGKFTILWIKEQKNSFFFKKIHFIAETGLAHWRERRPAD